MAFDGGFFGLIGKRLEWLAGRQNLVAGNIANADTPNYRPRDLDDKAFLSVLRGSMSESVRPSLTHRSHLQPVSTGSAAGMRPVTQREPYELSPSGNGVVLEEQLAKMTETHAQHAMLVNLYRKNMSMLRMALSGRR